MSAFLSMLRKKFSVDFCTQCEYPPSQYEGERSLRIAAFSHSGAGLSRQSILQSTQLSLRSAGFAGFSPVSFYC
jgi:hypothetical protein